MTDTADAADNTLALAQRHLAAGRFAEAAALCDRVLAAAPARPEALLLRALVAHRLGDNAMALGCLDRAVAAAPGFELAHYNRAVVLQAEGRRAEATEGYRRAIALKARRLGIGEAELGRRVFDGRIASARGWAEAHGAPFRAWPCAEDDSRPLPAHVYAPFCPSPNEDFLFTADGARVVSGAIRASHFHYVLTDDGMLLADRLNLIPRYHVDNGFSFAKTVEDGRVLLDFLDYPERPAQRGAFVLLGGVRNYYHWLFEFLPRIELVRRCPDLRIDGWLVNDDPAPYQRETLERLGVSGPLVFLPAQGLLPVERLHVPSVRRPADAVAFLRRELLDDAPAQGTRRLFVSRKDAATSRVGNEDALFAALQPLGFERVTGGALSVAAQAALFAEADVVVGVHGAGMTNIVFAPESARIVEIGGGRTAGFGFFSEIARLRGQAHHVVRGAGDPPAADPQQVVALVRGLI